MAFATSLATSRRRLPATVGSWTVGLPLECALASFAQAHTPSTRAFSSSSTSARQIRRIHSSFASQLDTTRASSRTPPWQRYSSTSASDQIPKSNQPQAPPLNPVNVPLIAPNLKRQLFPAPSAPFAPPPPTQEAISISQAHLREHGLLSDPAKPSATQGKKPKAPEPAVDFTLPKLQGETIAHHFHALGHAAAEPYASLATEFAQAPLASVPSSDTWQLLKGWVHYHTDGSWESIPFPPTEDRTMVFDVETLPFQGGAYPVLAVAVGSEGWYGWCSPWLTGEDPSPNHLIPFGPKVAQGDVQSLFEAEEDTPRLLIGHNVLFDRARVGTEYSLARPSTRWIDTLSLHVAVSGLTNPQRPAWMKFRKDRETAEMAAAAGEAEAAADGVTLPPSSVKKGGKKVPGGETSWKEMSSMNSLVDVARLHCGKVIDKSTRDVFIDPQTTIADVRSSFESLMSYCAGDVDITNQIYRVVLPKFLETCPHPASFGGILLMSQPVLPVDKHWPQYLERANDTYQERLKGVTDALRLLAEEARESWHERAEDGRYRYEHDVWLSQLDWSPKKARRLPGTLTPKIKKDCPHKPIEPAEADPSKKVAGASSGRPGWTESTALGSIETPNSPLSTILLQATWRGFTPLFTHSHGWLFAVSKRRTTFVPEELEELVDPAELGPKDELVAAIKGFNFYTVPSTTGRGQCRTLVTRKRVEEGEVKCKHPELLAYLDKPKDAEAKRELVDRIKDLADKAEKASPSKRPASLKQLDWSHSSSVPEPEQHSPPAPSPDLSNVSRQDLVWPQWYWDIDKPGSGLEVTIKKRAAALLLKLSWKGFPVVYSKQHGWIYRVPEADVDALCTTDNTLVPLRFGSVDDTNLKEDGEAVYFKLPHPDGEGKNVGSPLSKAFVAAFEDGTLSSIYPVARDALALNASCSYWASAQERIMNQMVIWSNDPKVPSPTPSAIKADPTCAETQGMILPQVVPMGTVTRRAVEKTWLTASNAKKNRVGSELKSMVRAPPGYAIVGADVDSEELWICSVMGDAQFGVHGATAIGWMTLEGTKAAGTDLHSKSASILGISRDDAKVFNYSRIYGAGVKHALQLLLKSNPALSAEQARKLVDNLYAGTKGLVDRSNTFDRSFWHGGTESFVFNKLEEIANSDRPRTPALGCGLTDALTKKYLLAEGKDKAGQGFIPSRVNWVVQSSGVDYLHLLLVSVEYLTKRFAIDARYMISVHDEVRYLVKDEDKYRLAMALQIANLWTRTLFAYRLQLGDLPQGCAFFSAVDVDTCFRKEVNMTCVTPSNPDPIPFGESLDIQASLESTEGGSLFKDGRPMGEEKELQDLPRLEQELTREQVVGPGHRVEGTKFLVAQTVKEPRKIRELWWSNRVATAKPESKVSFVEGSISDEVEYLRNDLAASTSRQSRPPTRSTPRPTRSQSKPSKPPVQRRKLGQPQTLAPQADEHYDDVAPHDPDEEREKYWGTTPPWEEVEDDVPEEVESEFSTDAGATRRAES